MLKNLKKVLFALVVALLAAFTFACKEECPECGPEANEENCSDFCETCKPEANDENCKDFCEECEVCGPEANDENCKDFQDFVAPTDFYIDVNDVKVGETVEVFVDEFEPEGAYEGLIFVSSNPEFATVDANGVVTGIRPGNVTITAYSVLDHEVSSEYDFEVKDQLSALEVIKREIAYLKAQLPNYVTETYEFPQPWNTNAKATYTVNGAQVDKLEVAANLAGDIKNTIGITVTYNDESDVDTTSVIWSVKDAKVNSFTRIEKAVAAADALMGTYALAGEKVTEDLVLPATIFGCTMNWASTLPTVIGADGKYVRPLDDKAITLSINATYGDNIGKASYAVVAKGYSAEEKAQYILENTFANINGKEFNTDLVLPEFDNTFGAKLTYKSGDTAVYDDNGKLVAAPAEAKDVKFTVTVDYAISAKDNFKSDIEVVVKAVPANKASGEVNAWLATETGKKFAEVAHTPYGLDEANLLDLPTEGYVWNVADVKLAVKDTEADPYQVFVLNAEGKVKLNAQYLRYTQVNLTGVHTADDGSKANVSLFLNIGISPTPMSIYTGTWRSSDQGDGSLTEIQGKYDLVSNVSYFDKKIGYVKTSYGSGYWSGYVFQTEVNGQLWEAYIMELMTVYVEKDAEGKAVYNVANINGGTGGNWGVLFVNNTGEDINIEVGTYGTAAYTLADGSPINSVGSRNNLAMDGYAPGFVVDKDGNVIHHSTDDKLEYGMENNQAYIGGKQYKAGNTIDAALYAGMADEFKVEGNWEAVHKATAALQFEVNAEGTYKKVTAEDGTVSYVAIAEGEEVTEKYAPKYAKDQVLTAEQFAALAEADKALVTTTYKALKDIDFTVKNLLGDSSKGTKVHYLTVPAGGYAMSWKYQFYGVGNPATLRAFTQPAEGQKVSVKHYDVHYLNCLDGETAALRLASAEELLALEDTAKNVTAETYVIAARTNYNKLTGATKADVFPEARLAAAEAKLAELVDKEIADFLASEATVEPAEFADGLGKLNNRLAKYTAELTALLTKKAEFDAKFQEYAKIDLTVTLDYKGGYAMGYYKTTDFEEVIFGQFLKDLYDHMIEKGAWKHKVVDGALADDPEGVAPTFAEFATIEYFDTNYAKNEYTLLSFYLFTAAYQNGEKVENYNKVIEGSDKFFNTERGNKWIDIMNWVDEGARACNYGGQDAWGKKGEFYQATKFELTNGVSDKYAGNPVKITNSGTVLGAFRFAQYICGKVFQAPYKNAIPPKTYATICNRQDTQELYSTVIYHCTDADVTLPEGAYKEGYKFLGWVFEDGTDAVITGSLFKDVTVYAKWAAAVEELVEAEVGKDLTPVFYGEKGANHPYEGTTPAGESVVVQAANTGIGSAAVVVGDKLFPLGAKALIELGKDATADAALTTKEQLQVYGTDGTTQNSTGLRYDATTGAVTVGNSYGYGAMYYNAGQFNLSVTALNTYGRNFDSEDHGYLRMHFVYNEEKKAYVGSIVKSSDIVVLAPGDYLWCPMSAERFCTGLSVCSGKNGVAGVLSEGVEVQIVRVKVAEDIPFSTVKFVDALDAENPIVLKAQYLENGKGVEKPVDPIRSGYKFLGWNTDKDATEGLESIPAEVAEDVTYYAIYLKFEKHDVTTLAEALNPEDPTVYTSLQEAINHTNDNGTVIISVGTFADDATIDHPVTIKGANAGVAGVGYRVTESVLTGKINVEADNVTFDGIKFAGASAADTRAVYVNKDVTNLVVVNNVFEVPFVSAARYLLAESAVVNGATIKNNKFFVSNPDNKATSEVYLDAIRLNNIKGHVVIENNDLSGFYGDNYTIFLGSGSIKEAVVDIIANKLDGSSSDNAKIYMSGSAVRNTDENSVVNVKYNEFVNNRETFLDAKGGKGTFNFEGNIVDYLKTTLFTDGANATLNVKKNYIVNGADVSNVEAFATREEALQYRIENYGVRTIEEVLTELAKAIKEYKGLTQSVAEIEQLIKNNDATIKVMYTANKQGVVDAELKTLANDPAYATVFMPLIDAFDAYVKNVNNTQSVWGSTWTGYLRISQLFARSASHVKGIHEQMVIDGLNKGLKAARDAKSIANMIANSSKVKELEIEIVNASLWTPDYYNNYLYLNTSKTSGTSWAAIFATLNEDGSYTVNGLKKSGDACPVDSADLTITAFSDNAADYAILLECGVQVGDVIVIPGGSESLVNGVQEPKITITVYRAN